MHKSFTFLISPKIWVSYVSLFCGIGVREITMNCGENHHTKNYHNIPKFNLSQQKNQRISHCFSTFYQKSFQSCACKNTKYMHTDQWHNCSQSNRTIVFNTEQKSLTTARPFQEPILLHLPRKHMYAATDTVSLIWYLNTKHRRNLFNS